MNQGIQQLVMQRNNSNDIKTIMQEEQFQENLQIRIIAIQIVVTAIVVAAVVVVVMMTAVTSTDESQITVVVNFHVLRTT